MTINVPFVNAVVKSTEETLALKNQRRKQNNEMAVNKSNKTFRNNPLQRSFLDYKIVLFFLHTAHLILKPKFPDRSIPKKVTGLRNEIVYHIHPSLEICRRHHDSRCCSKCPCSCTV